MRRVQAATSQWPRATHLSCFVRRRTMTARSQPHRPSRRPTCFASPPSAAPSRPRREFLASALRCGSILQTRRSGCCSPSDSSTIHARRSLVGSFQVRVKSEHRDTRPGLSTWPPSILAAHRSHRSVRSACLHRYRERGERTTGAFADRLKQMPLAMPQMCCALYLQAAGHLRQARRVPIRDLNGCAPRVPRQRPCGLRRSAVLSARRG